MRDETREIESFKTSELLHPEAMDLQTISDLLKERGHNAAAGDRGVRPNTTTTPPESEKMEKALEKYYNLVLPKPQRGYKTESRIGKRLQSQRQKNITTDLTNKSSDSSGNPKVEHFNKNKRRFSSNGVSEEGPSVPKRNQITWP